MVQIAVDREHVDLIGVDSLSPLLVVRKHAVPRVPIAEGVNDKVGVGVERGELCSSPTVFDGRVAPLLQRCLEGLQVGKLDVALREAIDDVCQQLGAVKRAACHGGDECRGQWAGSRDGSGECCDRVRNTLYTDLRIVVTDARLALDGLLDERIHSCSRVWCSTESANAMRRRHRGCGQRGRRRRKESWWRDLRRWDERGQLLGLLGYQSCGDACDLNGLRLQLCT